MRELKDCRTELADFAIALQTTLTERSKSIPKLNELLSDCLDFGILFDGVSGDKTIAEKSSVNRNEYAQLGAASFRKCVRFVSSLPHVKKVIKDEDLELGPAFSQQVFWRMKSTLINVMCGQHLESLFPKFFQEDSTGGFKYYTGKRGNCNIVSEVH